MVGVGTKPSRRASKQVSRPVRRSASTSRRTRPSRTTSTSAPRVVRRTGGRESRRASPPIAPRRPTEGVRDAVERLAGCRLAGDEHAGDPGRLGERLLRCPRRAGRRPGRPLHRGALRRASEAGAPRADLVHVPVNTWRAYNPWESKSLYDINSEGGRANRVSFERPPSAGLLQTWEWEIQLVRFLGGRLRRRLPDRRRHAPRSASLSATGSWSSMGTTSTGRAQREPPSTLRDAGTNLALHRGEHRLLADLIRGRGTDDRGRQGADRPLSAADSAGARIRAPRRPV